MEKGNPWWFNERDSKYELWKSSELKWKPSVIEKIPLKPFSLNFLVGPRQVGKTTALKILIHDILKSRNPKSIFYYSCDELVDFKELGDVLDSYLEARKGWKIKSSLIVLDEITFVHEWFRAVKARIDKGLFRNDVLIITGSGSIELLKHKEMFPGRRGNGKDIVFYPLSFGEYLQKIKNIDVNQTNLQNQKKTYSLTKANRLFEKSINKAFFEYLETGGFPLSIIDYHKTGKVGYETIKTYLDWIRGDFRKADKSERYMKEIIAYLLRSSQTPISWNSISKNTSIRSPHTVESYIDVLESLFVAKVLNLIAPDSRVMHRKNKKVYFIDPFLYKVFLDYTAVEVSTQAIVEALAVGHLSRAFDVYYFKNKSEVDCVCLRNKKQIGFEVKWTFKQARKPRHLKEFYSLDKSVLPLFFASAKIG